PTYPLSLHDALPIYLAPAPLPSLPPRAQPRSMLHQLPRQGLVSGTSLSGAGEGMRSGSPTRGPRTALVRSGLCGRMATYHAVVLDRKSTRLNSSHVS